MGITCIGPVSGADCASCPFAKTIGCAYTRRNHTVTILAQRVQDIMFQKHGVKLPVDVIDLVIAARNQILEKDENYGPGFNRDEIGFRTVDGKTSRYTRLNPK